MNYPIQCYIIMIKNHDQIFYLILSNLKDPFRTTMIVKNWKTMETMDLKENQQYQILKTAKLLE